MKTKQMSRWGVGPKFTIISVTYGAIVFSIQEIACSEVRFAFYSTWINIMLGILFIVAGLIIFLNAAFIIDKYFNKGQLCKKGAYAYLRHPIYAAWISFIVPGFVILRGSVFGITVPVFMYLIFRALIPVEEKYLLEKFGDEYIEYQSKVWAAFPKLWGK